MIAKGDGDPDLHQTKEEEIETEKEVIGIVMKGTAAIGDQAEAIPMTEMIITLKKKQRRSSKG